MRSTEKIITSRLFSFLIKVALVGAALVYLYKKVQVNSHFFSMRYVHDVFNDSTRVFMLLLLALSLTALSWWIEAAKWRFLVDKVQKTSLLKALKTVLSANTLALFTPNNIGEYAGRALHFESKAGRVKGAFLTLMGNLPKVLTILLFGLSGLSFFAYHYTGLAFMKFLPVQLILVASCIILLVWAYLQSPFLLRKLAETKLFKKLRNQIHFLSLFNRSDLLILLAYSACRYLVFTFQYFIVLALFRVELPLFEGMMLIYLVYLLVSFLPALALFTPVVRASVAISCIGLLSPNDTGILAASFVSWLLSIAFPSLIGSIFIFRINFFPKVSKAWVSQR